jgi:chromate transporter
MAPLTIGLLLATGWVLLEPARSHIATPLLVLATVGVMLKTKLSPLVPIALGALVGALGLLN